MIEELDQLQYTILDPAGNITALVESPVETSRQSLVAAELMRRHPEVEQVGFVCFKPEPALRMAGGEFCGNATMCTAVLSRIGNSGEAGSPGPEELFIRVSGTGKPVKVRLAKKVENCWQTSILMPEAAGIHTLECSGDGTEGTAGVDMAGTAGADTEKSAGALLPVVSMGGISHIIVDQESAFGFLLNDPKAAEHAIRRWCEELSAEGLGLMFLTQKKRLLPGPDLPVTELDLTPLVYIPGSGTIVWENSCASGSAAAAIYLAEKHGSYTDVTLREPGGNLRVTSDPVSGETWLYGQVRIMLRKAGASAPASPGQENC